MNGPPETPLILAQHVTIAVSDGVPIAGREHAIELDQPEVRLVDKRGCLECMARTLAGHVPSRQLAQLVMNERYQLM